MNNEPEVLVRVTATKIGAGSCCFILEEEMDETIRIQKLSFNLDYMFEYIEDSCYEIFIKNIIQKFLRLTSSNFELIYNVDNSDFKLFLKRLKDSK